MYSGSRWDQNRVEAQIDRLSRQINATSAATANALQCDDVLSERDRKMHKEQQRARKIEEAIKDQKMENQRLNDRIRISLRRNEIRNREFWATYRERSAEIDRKHAASGVLVSHRDAASESSLYLSPANQIRAAAERDRLRRQVSQTRVDDEEWVDTLPRLPRHSSYSSQPVLSPIDHKGFGINAYENEADDGSPGYHNQNNSATTPHHHKQQEQQQEQRRCDTTDKKKMKSPRGEEGSPYNPYERTSCSQIGYIQAERLPCAVSPLPLPLDAMDNNNNNNNNRSNLRTDFDSSSRARDLMQPVNAFSERSASLAALSRAQELEQGDIGKIEREMLLMERHEAASQETYRNLLSSVGSRAHELPEGGFADDGCGGDTTGERGKKNTTTAAPSEGGSSLTPAMDRYAQVQKQSQQRQDGEEAAALLREQREVFFVDRRNCGGLLDDPETIEAELRMRRRAEEHEQRNENEEGAQRQYHAKHVSFVS